MAARCRHPLQAVPNPGTALSFLRYAARAMAFISRLTAAQALQISLLAALLTIGLKTGAWWVTGSVGFLSDALESLVNLIAAGFALGMVLYAQQPPDSSHPYGHGKAEYFSAAFEGALILAAALAIAIAALDRWLHPQPLHGLGAGTLLSVVASLINLGAARILLIVGRARRSVALEADARHLLTDVWTTVGVVVGVTLAMLSGWWWLDPLVAILVALNILREAFHLMARAAHGLMDRALPAPEHDSLHDLLQALLPPGCHYADLRTRSSGQARFVDIKLRVPGHWTVRQAHDLSDTLELALKQHHYLLNTHIEPAEATHRKPRD